VAVPRLRVHLQGGRGRALGLRRGVARDRRGARGEGATGEEEKIESASRTDKERVGRIRQPWHARPMRRLEVSRAPYQVLVMPYRAAFGNGCEFAALQRSDTEQ
jgi:hypothetical protein